MSAPKIDVLAVWDREIDAFRKTKAMIEVSVPERRQVYADHLSSLIAVRAAVAELIEAAAEYRRGTECHVRDCVYCHDRSTRMDVALARISGAA